MARNPSLADEARCLDYAGFASHLKRFEFDIVYWFLFFGVIFLLFISSWYYAKCSDAADKYNAHSTEHRQRMRRCLIVCCVSLAIAITSAVLEVFMLLALQFCGGEDLMALYWSTWTTLQLGACIGIFGVVLSVAHSFRGRKHPPWSLALGTPVPVVAGFGHFLHHTIKSRIRPKNKGDKDTLPMSRATTQRTLVPDTEVAARIAGFGHDGGPIIVFESDPPDLPENATILGRDEEGHPVVQYTREVVQLRTEEPEPDTPPSRQVHIKSAAKKDEEA